LSRLDLALYMAVYILVDGVLH